MWAVCFIIVCINCKACNADSIQSGGDFFPLLFPSSDFFYLFPTISLQWEKHTMFSIIHEKRATTQWWLSFRCCVCAVFVRSHFVHRFCFSRFTFFCSSFISQFCCCRYYCYFFGLWLFRLALLLCIAWWQRMTMVYTSYPPNEYNLSDVIV